MNVFELLGLSRVSYEEMSLRAVQTLFHPIICFAVFLYMGLPTAPSLIGFVITYGIHCLSREFAESRQPEKKIIVRKLPYDAFDVLDPMDEKQLRAAAEKLARDLKEDEIEVWDRQDNLIATEEGCYGTFWRHDPPDIGHDTEYDWTK